ncbi:hypothetical protein BH11BAC2_BH11BAC2_19610 [soil metagenome]
MRKIFLLLIFFSGWNTLQAQSLKQDTLFTPDAFRQYQFQLEKPAHSIDSLRYDKTGEPIKGILSPDGSRVIMDNYKKGSRVRLKANYTNGISEEVIKSPCFIDPVTYEL